MSDKDLNTTKHIESLEAKTKCVLCAQTFQGPSTSLCIHKFCERCLQELATKLKRSNGVTIPCPLCGKEFLIPEAGLDAFQKNLFKDKLVELKYECKPSSAVSVCDSCLEDPSFPENEVPFAEAFCTDCEQKLCKECHRYHLKSKSSKNHRVVNLEDQLKNEMKESIINFNMSELCELHAKKPLDIFCLTCSEAVCSICFVDSHKAHDGSSVFNMTRDFLEWINGNDCDLSEFALQLQQKRAKLDEDKAKFIDQISELEIEIIECKEDLKGLLEEHSQSLLMQLKIKRETSLKSMEMCTEDIDLMLASMESLKSFCKVLQSVASSSNICKLIGGLKNRALELREQCHSELENGFEYENIWLKHTITQEALDSCGVNLIGTLEDLDVTESEAELFDTDRESFTTECTEKEECAMIKLTPESLEDFNKLKESNVLQFSRIQELEADKFELTMKVKDLEQKILSLQSSGQSIPNKNLIPFQDGSSSCRLDCGEYCDNHSLERLDVHRQDAGPSFSNEPMTFAKEAVPCHFPTSDPMNYKHGGKRLLKFNSISESSAVWAIKGLAVLEEEFFLAVNTPDTTVEVYDLKSLLFKRRWTHKKLHCIRDMKSCRINKCLYVMNETTKHASNEIIRFDLNGILVSFWSVKDSKGQLSVTSEATILFTSWNKNEITEYRCDGQQVRVIPLSWNYGFSHPSHAIKLNSNNILVSHGVGKDPMQRICIIDTAGRVLACVSKFKIPLYLDKDRFDNFLVVESGKRCLKVYDSCLNVISDKFYTPSSQNRITKSIIDEAYRRVFVVEWQYTKRKLVLQDKCHDLLTVLIMDPV